MKLARQARRMGPLLLLTALVVGAHAADDDEWAPAGDHQKIKASVPGANAPAEPAAEAAISAAAGSPALQPFVAKVAEVNAMARQGDYAGARQLARQSAIEVAAVGVTGDFIKTGPPSPQPSPCSRAGWRRCSASRPRPAAPSQRSRSWRSVTI